MADITPCYVAVCDECTRIVGASVLDPERPDSLRRAVGDRKNWERRKLLVRTMPVHEVRVGAWGHAENCSRNWKRRTGKLLAAERK